MIFPSAFLTRMERDLSEEDFPRFLDALQQPSVHSLLLNKLRSVSRDDLPFTLSETAVSWEPGGFYCEAFDAERPGRHSLHEAGAYYLQEASAMAPARMLLSYSDGQTGSTDPVSDDGSSIRHLRVLDLCAAPGGKSIDLAMLLPDESLLVSNEIHPARAKILSQNIERMGISNDLVLNEKPERLADRFPGFFDRILVDAPCSGEGMFRKNPEAAAEWSPENVEMCAERQALILDAAWRMLSPGGRIVYSTCTFSPAEDEEQIARFLARNPDCTLLTEKKLFPHEIRGEGHYCALLSKEGTLLPEDARAAGGSLLPQKKDRADQIRFMTWAEEALSDAARKQLKPDRIFRFGEALYQAPPICPDLAALRVLRPGLCLADLQKDRMEPAHALSHTLRTDDVKHSVDLNADDIAAYLNGQSLRPAPERMTLKNITPGDRTRGDVLITCHGLGAGWGRLAGGMIKNRYPKGLRSQFI